MRSAGKSAAWMQIGMTPQTPDMMVQSGGERLRARADVLSLDGAAREFRYCIRQHPFGRGR